MEECPHEWGAAQRAPRLKGYATVLPRSARMYRGGAGRYFAVNFVQPRKFMSRSVSFCQANSGCLAEIVSRVDQPGHAVHDDPAALRRRDIEDDVPAFAGRVAGPGEYKVPTDERYATWTCQSAAAGTGEPTGKDWQ